MSAHDIGDCDREAGGRRDPDGAGWRGGEAFRVPRAGALAIALMALACACAHTPPRVRHVPIEQRATPAQPGPTGSASKPAPAPRSRRRHTVSGLAADTLATRAVLSRCAGRRLLPEQEATLDSATKLLSDARAALAVGDTERAAALAREARQLTRSLDCGR